MRQALLALAFCGLVVSFAPARADDTPAKKQGAANQAGTKQAYLGVGVEVVPQALAHQMSGVVPKGQGLLVEQVAKDSPAAKAGLQPYDILLSYAGQKLSTPEQLVKLVREGKPGHEIALEFVRNGKSESGKITLGEREVAGGLDQEHVFRLRPDERLRDMFEDYELKNGTNAWQELDGLKLTRLDAQRWRAEVDYRSDNGKKEHKAFEGTGEEIRKDVQSEKDLPANERSHLLRALNLHEPVFEFHFPAFDKMGLDSGDRP